MPTAIPMVGDRELLAKYPGEIQDTIDNVARLAKDPIFQRLFYKHYFDFIPCYGYVKTEYARRAEKKRSSYRSRDGKGGYDSLVR